MTVARRAAAAVQIDEGRVGVFGGASNEGELDSTETMNNDPYYDLQRKELILTIQNTVITKNYPQRRDHGRVGSGIVLSAQFRRSSGQRGPAPQRGWRLEHLATDVGFNFRFGICQR